MARREVPLVEICGVVVLGLMLSVMLHETVSVEGSTTTFNVLNYGAVGDGSTDDSPAFTKAWKDACNAESGPSTIEIPQGKTYLVYPVTFTGPCKSRVAVQLWGVIIAPSETSAWRDLDPSKWVVFKNVDGLEIHGPGTIDGRGQDWWDVSCRYHPGPGCIRLAPTALGFDGCNQVGMNQITIKDSPQTHVLVIGCRSVNFNSLTIQSPGDSPNTDGIHLQSSRNVTISNTKISSGDDCISIGDQTSNINITVITCGPGHGISIGSLGRDGREADVHDITVNHVTFINTTNGVRIKTWQAGRGQVRQVQFMNMNFTDVQNPIIIDQHYCGNPGACPKTTTGVKLSEISYTSAVGTSSTLIAVNLNCSDSFPCENVNLNTIDLKSAVPGQTTTSACNNAYGHAAGTEIPKSCLRE